MVLGLFEEPTILGNPALSGNLNFEVGQIQQITALFTTGVHYILLKNKNCANLN